MTTDILMIVTAGLIGGVLAQIFRQPLLLGYLLAGIVIGPHTPGFTVSNIDFVNTLADVGAALLLFSLGLEFPLKTLRPIRKIAFGGTLIQVGLTLAFCTAFGIMLGFNTSSAWWFGTAFVSSSTAVILKTLASQGYTGTLSGRLMLGMSIVQDLTVIPIMIILCNLAGSTAGGLDWWAVVKPILYTVSFVAIMAVIGSRLTPKVLYYVAQLHSRELFLLIITVIGLGVGYLTSCFGLSYAFGAFVAGMVLSESDYSHKAVSELGSLRDIFVLIFFVSVGMLCDPTLVLRDWRMMIGVFLIATFGRGLILAGITYLFGYRRVIPVAVLFGMLPISEIAFVLIQQGASIGAIDDGLYNLILNVTVFSMLVGPLFSSCTPPVYRLICKLRPQKKAQAVWERSLPMEEQRDHLILTGGALLPLAELLSRAERKFVFIAGDHKEFLELKARNWPVIYGDPLQVPIMEAAGAAHASMVVIPAETDTEALVLIDAARSVNQNLPVLVHWCNEQGKPQTVQMMDAVTVVEAEPAATAETMRAVLFNLGWSVPEVYNCLRKLHASHDDEQNMKRDRYGFPLFLQFFSTAALEVEAGSRWDGCAIRDCRLREEYALSVLGVARQEKFLPFPPADFVLEAHDRVLLLGRIDACEKWNLVQNTEVLA